MSAAKGIWRPTISSDEVFALLDLIEQAQLGTVTGLNPLLLPLSRKLDSLAYDIGRGNRKPAYVATGRNTKPAVSLDSLDATPAERLAAELSPAEEDELDRLDRQMREELAAAGNANVVLEERRASIRIEQEVQEAGSIAGPSDEDLFNQL